MNQVQTSKLELFKEQLQEAISQGKISNWYIYTSKNRKQNIYVEKNYKVESLLESKREEYTFTIYTKDDELMGESTFSLSETDSQDDFKRELEDAIFICSQGKIKPYTLPEKDEEEIQDSHIDYDLFYDKDFERDFNNGVLNLFVAQKIAEFKAIIDASTQNDLKVILNSLEFHNSLSEKSINSSTEIYKEYKKNTSYIEFVLTARDEIKGDETEHIVYQKINDLYNFNYEDFFQRAINHVKDTIRAKKSENFEGEVFLTGVATKDFFVPGLSSNSVIAHASGRMKFFNISSYEIGKEVIKAKYDKLTVYSNPLVLHNGASSPYDEYGTSSKKLCILEKGHVKNLFANRKFAEYLGMKSTGGLGVIEVECGENSELDLFEKSKNYIEIVSFASFDPDTVSGDFSAEIRLGYKVSGGVKTPFKGGLFTGNVFKILEEVEFSKEKLEDSGYIGPRTIKFRKGEIVGV